jgi:uncharacterized membrane protein
MENLNNVSDRVTTTNNNANETSHYILLTVGIVIGMIGIMLRFVVQSVMVDMVANFIFIVGTYFTLKAVFAILR